MNREHALAAVRAALAAEARAITALSRIRWMFCDLYYDAGEAVKDEKKRRHKLFMYAEFANFAVEAAVAAQDAAFASTTAAIKVLRHAYDNNLDDEAQALVDMASPATRSDAQFAANKEVEDAKKKIPKTAPDDYGPVDNLDFF